MSRESLQIEFLHEGCLFLNPERDFKIEGDDDSITLEVGTLEKTVPYDHFDELLEAKKERFKTACVQTILIKNVDFNRVSADRIEQLFEGVGPHGGRNLTVKFEMEKEQYNESVFLLIKRLEGHVKILLTMRNFILNREELLQLKAAEQLKSTGDIDEPIDDNYLLALVNVGHEVISLHSRIALPETIKDTIKIVDIATYDRLVIITVSDELFKQFICLIGARFNADDDELVMEDGDEAFTVLNKGEPDCVGEYSIVYKQTIAIVERTAAGGEWLLTITTMGKEEEDNDDSEDENSDQSEDEMALERELFRALGLS